MHLQYYFGDDFKQFEDYLSSIEHTVFECKKDTPLSGVGAPLDKEYYVLEGMIRTSFIHESGHIKAFAFYGPYTFAPLYYPGDYKIEGSLIFTASTDLRALAFDRKLLGHYLNKNPELNQAMYDAYMRLVVLLIEDNINQLFSTGLEKIAHFLYSTVTNSGNPVVLISQDDLANFVGMNRANVAKYLKQLREEKIIETARNRIIVKNTKKLQNYTHRTD